MKSLSSKLPHTLVQQARWLHDLNQQLLLILPLEFEGHVQLAGLHHGILTLEADSPAWAAKTRYLTHEISKQLAHKTGLTIKSVKLVIRPSSGTQTKRQRKNPYISKQSAHQLKSLARVIEHGPLKNALNKLAKHGEK